MLKETGWKSKVIREASEIRLILQTGKKIQTRWYQLFYRPTTANHARFTIIAGRRLGTAVHRNRMKRRFRELLRKDATFITSEVDMVLIPKPASLKEDIHILQIAVRKSLILARGD